MTLWHPDTCDCVVDLGPDGEPTAILKAYARHAIGSEPADIATECRAKEAAREIVKAELQLSEAPEWVRADDGRHEVLIPDGVTVKKREAIEAKLLLTGLSTKTVSEFIAAEATVALDG